MEVMIQGNIVSGLVSNPRIVISYDGLGNPASFSKFKRRAKEIRGNCYYGIFIINIVKLFYIAVFIAFNA